MEIMELATMLGQAIKADPKVVEMQKAQEEYEKDEKIQCLMLEYNTQQIALAEEYKKEAVDEKLVKAIEERLEQIVKEVTESEIFVRVNKAGEAVNALMTAVNGEIEFQITGKRPCAHDCSSCGSDCGHHHHHD